MKTYDTVSLVEKRALERSGRAAWYPPTEKIQVIEVPDFPGLGQLTALRFIEWLQKNPGGSISLPTGKTPEHFIVWTNRYLSRWDQKDVAAELADWGIDPAQKPDLRSHPFIRSTNSIRWTRHGKTALLSTSGTITWSHWVLILQKHS